MEFIAINWKALLEILILWSVIYHVLLFFEGTRAIQVLRGIITLLFAFFLSQAFGLEALSWLLTKLFALSVIALLIIFHPEIRQGLARLGQRRLFLPVLREEQLEHVLRELVNACEELRKAKRGALIAIENKESLAPYMKSGEQIDALVSSDLIQTIFAPNTILHDGGMIIQHGRIAAAGCIFPLTQQEELSRIYGTRHRAALGLSEETDAIIIIVSEERQDVSLVYRSALQKNMPSKDMLARIRGLIALKKAEGQ